MKALIVIIAIFITLAPSMRADFKTGLEAYNSGNYAAALENWLPIAEKGDANAQYNVALLYARGEGIPQDIPKAAEWYRKAAEQGVAAAQYNLGVILANGQGVPQNITEARNWFEKAAAQDVAEAQDVLGYIYGAGQGVKQDFAEALKWYRRAAERGVAGAQFNLGVMHDLGQGVERNPEEALSWYRKAAEQGYDAAYCNIGILYYNAQGVKRDLVESYAWVSRCQAGGDPRAGQLVRILESRMKPDDISRGRELAAAWKPAGAGQRNAETAHLFAGHPGAPAASAATTPGPGGLAAPRTAGIGGVAMQPAADAPASAAAVPSPGGQATPQPATAAQPEVQRPEPVPAPATKPAPADTTGVQDTWSGVARVVAVGDVHGDFEQFVAVLESAGLIDSNGDWTGGAAHLVQTGNVVGGGPDSRKVLDLLRKLERQAAAAGGAVHCLVGNYEAMNVYGDLRHVSQGEFASFREQESDGARTLSYQQFRGLALAAKPDLDRRNWGAGYPPGFTEHRQAFSPEGDYGRWIAHHNAVIKIDGTLFASGGISSKYADWDLRRLNDAVRAELAAAYDLRPGVVTDPEGPLWYQGLATGGEAELAPLVDRILRAYGVERIVIGQALSGGAVTERFGGKVLLVNVGLSRVYENGGRLSCLVIENGTPYALYRGQKLQLPRDGGPDLLRYLKQAAALDPQPSPLAARIAALEGAHRP
ncbi:MAG TPA: metallophosphoesterase [Bryobacteraceae bacterium]|nr:metallophosphoesterase [Bryobacteraceae bacterium]